MVECSVCGAIGGMACTCGVNPKSLTDPYTIGRCDVGGIEARLVHLENLLLKVLGIQESIVKSNEELVDILTCDDCDCEEEA